jgi:MFS family permease
MIANMMGLILFMDRTNISIAAPGIIKEFGLTKTQMGIVFGAFYWAYALGQIPGGWLADSFGPRKILTILVLFWSIMTVATAHAIGLASLLAIRFAFGLGEAGAWPAATRAMQHWFINIKENNMRFTPKCEIHHRHLWSQFPRMTHRQSGLLFAEQPNAPEH